jgi:hypothetical protein
VFADIDSATAGEQQQPQRLPSLACSWQGKLAARERRPGGTCRVESVVFALQPPLATRAPAGLEHQLAAAAQIADKTGAVMARSLDRPDTPAGRVLLNDRTAWT